MTSGYAEVPYLPKPVGAAGVPRVVKGRPPPARDPAPRGRRGSRVQGAAQRHRASDAEGALDPGGTAPHIARHPRGPHGTDTRSRRYPQTPLDNT